MQLEIEKRHGKQSLSGLAGLFKKSAAQNADRVALSGPDGEGITYALLDRLTDALAVKLAAAGLDCGEIAGVTGGRSIQTFVLMLAVQKAGAVYMPLDISLPESRRAGMEAEARCRLVLDAGNWQTGDDLPPFRKSQDSHTRCPESADVATVIFTSGSTGRPKGALNSHAALANMAASCARAWELSKEDRCLQFVSIGFDVSLEEVWTAWSVGAAVVIPPEKVRLSFDDLLTFLERSRITVMHLPAAYWNSLTGELEKARVSLPDCLRLVIIGGETTHPAVYQKWRAATGGSVRLAVEYGLSETAVTSTIYRDWIDGAPDGRGIPVGRPLSGVEIRIIKDNGQTAGDGESGEIVIGGRGVGAGYLNLPEETGARFVKTADGLVFRTGDIGYRDSDGLFFFKGRHDQQVKINGHRIELGEIESHLLRIPGIREGAVRLETRPNGHRCIHAYVAADTGNLDSKSIQESLASTLPAPMVPATITILDDLPKSPNGKIDLSRLAVPTHIDPFEQAKTRARGNFETRVVAASAQTTLGTPVSIDARFTDLGGDSLTATEMSANLAACGFHVEAHQILMAESLRDLAQEIGTGGGESADSAIVHLAGQTGHAPVILFHATPGDLLGYRHLAQILGRNRRCYGILSPALRKDSGFSESIEEMATGYADQIIASGIPQPYHLTGWCFGGLLAFETAIQLRNRGCEVGYVGLIETPSPGILASRWLRTRLRIISMLRRGPRAILKSIINNIRKKKADLAAGTETEIAAAPNEALYHANLAAANSYPKKHYSGAVELFLSSEESLSEGDDHFGWRPCPCADSYTHHVIPGDHTGMLQSPGADLIADVIEKSIACLDVSG